MTSILFVWIMNAGAITLATEPQTFYTLEACNAAARKAENAGLLFEGVMTKTQVRAYCSPKKLSKDDK
jgi:hypothetical protein